MNKKTYSLGRYLVTGWTVISSFILGACLVYGIYSVWRYREDFLRSNYILVDNYASLLNKDYELMQSYIGSVFSEDIHYQKLQRPYLTEKDWITATYFLRNNMETKANSIDYFGGVYYYDTDNNSLVSLYSDYSFSGDIYRLNHKLKEYLNLNINSNNREGIMIYENEVYLVYLFGIKGEELGFVINLSRYFEQAGDLQLIFYDQEGNIVVNTGAMVLHENDLKNALNHEACINNGMEYIITTAPLEMLGLRLAVVRHTGRVFEFWKNWEFWLLFIFIPLTTIVGFWMINKMFNRILMQSVEHLVDRITEMKKEGQVDTNGRRKKRQIKEFEDINQKLNEMIDEIELLQQEKFKKEMEANAAQLQYYQLQVNPHFFLNCLNILDSLLDNKNVHTVKKMIFALSNHFRYVFQDRSNQVTVREEIEEVNAYCNIYIIKGGVPILFQAQADEDTLEYKVPILCIQTFVENSIKYAREKGQILSIKVTVHQIEDERDRFLCIRISDNGVGYPAEKLQELNTPVTEFQYFSQHVGIDNIKYRIYLMYGKKAKLYFYNGPSGEAVTEILLPERMSHESDCD